MDERSGSPPAGAIADRLAAREEQLARLRSGLSEEKRAALERRLRGAAQAAPAASTAIPRRVAEAAETGTAPTSLAQERLWFLAQLDPLSPAYNLAAAVRLEGDLDLPALRRALVEVVRRHESLRTTFASRSGEPVQVIAPAGAAERFAPLPVVDLSAVDASEAELHRLAATIAEQPFDLAAGPLLAPVLLRESPVRSTLVITQHHIITDAWSTGVLIRELAALYSAFTTGRPAALPELPIQYADYASWQRGRLTGPALAEQLAWWRQELAGLAPELPLPTDRPRPAQPSGRGASRSWHIGPAPAARLRGLAQESGATLFMVLLAAFEGLLSRLSGQTDIAVGSPVAGRTRVETEGLIGFFVNTLVLRLDLGGSPDFRTLVARTRDVTLGAFAHQEIPFDRLVAELRPERAGARNPLFQILFVLQNAPAEPLRLPGLTLSAWPASTGAAMFDLVLEAVEGSAGIGGVLEFSRDLFDATTAERIARCFTMFLAAVAAAPERRFDDLPLLGEEERHQVLYEWSGGPSPYPRDGTIHGLFAEWARRTPDAVAVTAAATEENLTYGELAVRAGELARRLRGAGVGPEIPVAVCLARSPHLIVALLAVLEAGGAYVPLDPAYPRERLALMLEELGPSPPVPLSHPHSLPPGEGAAPPKSSKPEREGVPPLPGGCECVWERGPGGEGLLLTEERFAGLFTWFAKAGGGVIRLDAPEQPSDRAGQPMPTVLPENLAYVMYTSGSTGRPKGVASHHRGVVRLVRGDDTVRLAPDEVALQLGAVSFDVSSLEIWGPLLNGGRLVLMSPETPSPSSLAAVLERHRVTTVCITPALFHQMIDDRLDGLRAVQQIVAGGDVLSPPHMRRVLAAFPGMRLINGYGPTENATFTCYGLLHTGIPGAAVPIGRPLADTDVQVAAGEDRLDPLVPIGVVGELLAGGDGLARGYWRRPDLTAERFRPHPFPQRPGARAYHTGDLVRFLADGRLDFLGRADRQVKVRGYRIEPAEVEAALTAHPEIRSAVAVALPEPGEGGAKRLVAYLVMRDAAVPPAGLRSWLRERLPDYMVPQSFVTLPEMPLTATGKIDRAALPAPEAAGAAKTTVEARAPRSLQEELLAGIWAEVLGRERVDPDDDFFDLGGHSLLATRVASRVREVFGVELPLRRLFEAPTVSALAAELAAARRPGAGGRIPVLPRAGADDLPLSFAQERLWFLDQLEPGGTAYNLALPVALKGHLLPAALGAAVGALEHRHEGLRTRFPAGDGQVRQEILPPAAAPDLPVIDLAALPLSPRRAERDRLIALLAAHRFDLARGPLVLWALLRLDDGDVPEYVFVIVQHHIITDGWSLGVMLRELALLYTAFAAGRPALLPPAPLQYADYAVWQREMQRSGALEAQLAWWRGRLAGELPALDLPADRPRTAAESRRGGSAALDLGLPRSARVAAVSRRAGATPFMTLLAAWMALLHRLSGQDDLLIGVPIAGRNRAEIEGTLGFFVNTLVLRGDLGGNPAFGALLAQVRETALDTYAHQDLPFEHLVAELQPERDLDRTPLFQVFFNHLNFSHESSREPMTLPGLTLAPLETGPPASKFDLSIYLAEGLDGFRFDLLYDAGLFAAGRIAEMLRQLAQLLSHALDDPQLAAGIDDISLITPEAAAVLPDPAQPLAAAALPSVQELFAQQSRRSPSRIAVLDQDEIWTYGRLEAAANRLARYLMDTGLAPGDVVAIAAERRAALAWAVLGVLKAGCAFLLLDPDYPEARRDAMQRLGGARALLRLTETVENGVDLGAPHLSGRPDAPAYVAFTSGSTGEPKAILGTHAPLTHFFAWQAATFGLDASDRFSLLSGLSHDPLLRDLLAPLTLGATLCVPPRASLDDPERIGAWLAAQRVTVMHLTPALGQLLAQGAPELPDLRFAFFGGDRLTAADVARLRRMAPTARVVSFYGATETPQGMGWHEVMDEPWTLVPLGAGIDGVQLLVRNGRGVQAGIGELGEIVVRTPYLARGYLGDEALTRERFLADPQGGAAQLYRTGDLGRYRLDGGVDFAGRADRQIKIRGFRIEPAEIEAALVAEAEVAEAVVAAEKRPHPRPSPSSPLPPPGEGRQEEAERGLGDSRTEPAFPPSPGDRAGGAGRAAGGEGAVAAALAAFIVLHPGAAVTEAELRRRLSLRLPAYMVPAAILVIDHLPLTPNRKVDRRALLQRFEEERTAAARITSVAAPRDPIEEGIAGIWEELLGRGPVGIHDSFFALGGHSLLAAQVLSRLRRAFAVEMPLRRLFETPTVAGLAQAVAVLRAAPGIEAPPLVRQPAGSEHPLSFAQESLWIFEQLSPGTATYNMPVALRLRGPADEAALVAGLTEIARRQGSLRTSFAEIPGIGPVQEVAAEPAMPALPVIDLTALPADRREEVAQKLAAAEAARPFELTCGPLWRARLLRLASEERALLFAAHHIICDGWSIGVLAAELGALYEAFAAGRPSPLPELAVQYTDYAAWQRRWLDGAALAAQLDFWRTRLHGAPALLELPTDRPRPVQRSHAGARLVWELPATVAAALTVIARRHGATPFMILLAAFQTVLSRHSGQEDLVVGLSIAHRNRVEIEPLIGFFVNLLALRGDLRGDPPFTRLLEQARDTTLDALDHQDLPFERLVKELRPERGVASSPLFQVLCTLQNMPLEPRLAGLRLEPFERGGQAAHYDLTLSLAAGGDSAIAGYLEYDADLFDAATARRLLGHFETLLAAVAEAPDRPLSELPMLSEAERRQLLEWGDDAAQAQAALASHSSLEDAAVIALPGPGGGRRLIAYIVPYYGEEPASAAELRRHLRARLPETLLPDVFIPLPELPRTAGGEVDRRALPRTLTP